MEIKITDEAKKQMTEEFVTDSADKYVRIFVKNIN